MVGTSRSTASNGPLAVSTRVSEATIAATPRTPSAVSAQLAANARHTDARSALLTAGLAGEAPEPGQRHLPLDGRARQEMRRRQ